MEINLVHEFTMYTLWILTAIVTIASATLLRVPLIKNEAFTGTSEQLKGHKSFLLSHYHPNVLDEIVTESMYEPKYFGNISVGSPPQEINVIFDTLLSDMWVYGDCLGKGHSYDDSYENCPDWAGFQPNKSSSYDRLHTDYYASDSISSESLEGPISTDVVQIQDAQINKQLFALENELGSMKLTGWGIFALGTQKEIYTGLPSPIENMLAQNIISNLIFSMYLEPDDSANVNTFSGEIIFGGSDPSLYVGNLSYTSFKNASTYQFQVESITFMKESLCRNCYAEIVPVVSTFGAPQEYVNAIIVFLGGHLNKNKQGVVDCSVGTTAPDLLFEISGQTYNLPIAKLLQPVDGSGASSCILVIESLSTPTWLIGDAFLTLYYTEFDVENQRIGFAPLVSTYSPSQTSNAPQTTSAPQTTNTPTPTKTKRCKNKNQ